MGPMSDQDMLLSKLDEFSNANSDSMAKEMGAKYAPAPEPMAEMSPERPPYAEIPDIDGNMTRKSSISSENGADGLGDPMQLLAALTSDEIMKLLGDPESVEALEPDASVPGLGV